MQAELNMMTELVDGLRDITIAANEDVDEARAELKT